MKQFFMRWAYSYSIVNIIFLLLCFVILKRLNINISFLNVSLGAIFISFFITSSITIFKAKSLKSITRTIGGFLLISPIVLITRKLFGVILFRFSFTVYIFALICAIIYAIAVIFVTKKAKTEEKTLNELLLINSKIVKNEDDKNIFNID